MKTLVAALAAMLCAAACSPQPAPPAAPAPAAAAPAPAPAPQQAAAPADAPPTEKGLYAAKNSCPFEGCSLRKWRALKPVELHWDPALTAPVRSSVPAGEWVTAMESVSLLVPQRGVVVSDMDHLKKDDVVHLLEGQGEGAFSVWRRGEILDWMDNGDRDDADPNVESGIRWDTPMDQWAAKAKAAGAGWWVHILRPGGEGGWALDPAENFDCSSLIDQAADCGAHNP